MKKILVIAFAIIFIAIMITPVLAFGPMKVPEGKNKNIYDIPSPTQLYLWNQVNEDATGDEKPCNGPFQEWMILPNGRKFRLWRFDAARVKIGNAIVLTEDNVSFMTMMQNGNKWHYLNQDVLRVLYTKMGWDQDKIDRTCGWFPEGVFFRVNLPGN